MPIQALGVDIPPVNFEETCGRLPAAVGIGQSPGKATKMCVAPGSQRSALLLRPVSALDEVRQRWWPLSHQQHGMRCGLLQDCRSGFKACQQPMSLAIDTLNAQ